MKFKPCGPTIIVEIKPVEETYEGTGIIRPTNETKREVGGRDIGYIRAIGPTAYKTLVGCESIEDWGAKVNVLAEFNRYDGKVPRGAELFDTLEVEGKEIDSQMIRMIHDNDVIAVYEE